MNIWFYEPAQIDLKNNIEFSEVKDSTSNVLKVPHIVYEKSK